MSPTLDIFVKRCTLYDLKSKLVPFVRTYHISLSIDSPFFSRHPFGFASFFGRGRRGDFRGLYNS